MSNNLTLNESRCPIHGTISFNNREKQIIDHPFFQRLRYISQLGFTNYVYTGATHSRFGHSLGVMHLAGGIFDRILSSEPNCLPSLFPQSDLLYFRQIVRFAALLHDVGHPPFSHSSEATLPQKKCLDLPLEWYKSISLEDQATHEDFSVAIIYALANESNPLLSLEEAQDICSLIESNITVSNDFVKRCQLNQDNSKNIHPLLKHIISGEVDADRMDYLHRDSHYAGVNYGKFDRDHLVRSLSCVQSEEGIVLILNHNALHTYENFLLARLHMFLQVYFHKTLLPFDYYLEKAMIEEELDFTISGTLENFLGAQDHSVLSALYHAKEQKWSSRIILRKPSKRLFQFEHYHSPELKDRVLDRLKQENIEYFFLQSSQYLSMLSSNNDTTKSTLLLKTTMLDKIQYLPIQEVSLLLGQYQQSANIQYLYCEPEDYENACQVLSPLMA